MNRILTKKQVAELTTYSTRHIERLVQEGRFPNPIKLSPSGTRIGWLSEDIENWLNTRERRVY